MSILLGSRRLLLGLLGLPLLLLGTAAPAVSQEVITTNTTLLGGVHNYPDGLQVRHVENNPLLTLAGGAEVNTGILYAF